MREFRVLYEFAYGSGDRHRHRFVVTRINANPRLISKKKKVKKR